MNLRRSQILAGDYVFPTGLITLKHTNHFKARLEERGMGLQCIPTVVRVSRNNIHSAKTDDNKHLKSVVIRLDYTSSKYLFLILNPFDGAVKSLWFVNKKRGK